jgi:hypothetical protein
VISCELRPGRHLLRMQRSDHILHEEWFTARRGENVVLVAWNSLSSPKAWLACTRHRRKCRQRTPGR